MNKLLVRIVGILSLISAPLFIATAARAVADTCTWTGGGIDENFSNAANWSGCDNGTVPENGDTLVLDATVDSDTTFGDDRILNNDIVGLTVAGISVSNAYPDGDFDNYTINGNDFSTTGSISGGARSIHLGVNLTVTGAGVILTLVDSTGNLAIGSNDVTLSRSSFDGSLSGSGGVTLFTASALGGGAGSCSFYGDVSASMGRPFMAASPGFSGSLTVGNNESASITSLADSFARNASSITLSGGTVIFLLNSNQDMTFATPMTLNGGVISVSQAYTDSGCDTYAANRTVNITSAVTVTSDVEVRMRNSNLTFSGTVSGAGSIEAAAGYDATAVLTVNGQTSTSQAEIKTYAGSQPSVYPYAGENQVVIIEAGATTNDVTVFGGILKGVGTVGNISMTSGTVAPGLSPGCLASSGLNYTGGTLEIEINGPTVCTEYDQQTVTGTVNLGTATALDINRLTSYRPALNSTYTIISNDGADPVTGTFSGLPQGATVVVDGVTYTISYTGGDGNNDVVLTVTAVDASVGAPNTGVVQLVRSGTILPLLAIAAAFGIIGINFATKKK